MLAHSLPTTLDTDAAGPLRQVLLATIQRGEDIHCDGVEVARIGQACLQVLASARSTALARNVGFRIDNPSEAMSRMIAVSALAEALAPITAPATGTAGKARP